MKRLAQKLKGKHGFSLVEMTIAVAVMAVLFAVSAPLVSEWVVSLKMAELDNHAKEIYLGAQYQLTAQKAESGLGAFSEKMVGEFADRKLTQMPPDFNAADADGTSELYYLERSDGEMIEYLVPEVSYANNLTGDYVIELNPFTGTVYGVFYWDKNDEIVYDTHIEPLNSMAGGRARANRVADRLGYYGGEMDPDLPLTETIALSIIPHDGEELYLDFAIVPTAALLRYSSNVSIEVTVTDESGDTWTTMVSGPLTNMGATLNTYLLLDSMEVPFTRITEGALTPGDNLQISAVATFTRTGYAEARGEATAQCNSLFATPKTDTAITVSAVRHLWNLDAARGFVHVPEGIVTIEQGADIDFNNKNFAWDGDEYMGPGQDNPISDLPAISNSALLEKGVAYNGNTLLLRNFEVSANGGWAGLFASAKNMTFTGVRLENIRVEGAGANAAGALAGELVDCTVSDCGVYLQTLDEYGLHYSLAASADGNYTNEMARRYDYYSVDGANSVGGLCGSADNVDFASSFAAIRVTGSGDFTGGFVGSASGGSVEDCYSSGDVSGRNNVGGFAGRGLFDAVSNCYTTGDVWAASYAGGFVASSAGTYENCYSYGQVLGSGGNGIPANSGGFVASSGSAGFAGCVYLQQEGYNSDTGLQGGANSRADADGVTHREYDDLRPVEGDISVLKEQSFPYEGGLVGDKFPFKGVLNHHYGDWPPRYVIDTSLVYYEVYEDGSYGYYCVTGVSAIMGPTTAADDMIWVLDTLQDRIAVEDGYALLSVYDLDRFDYELDLGADNRNNGVGGTKRGTMTVADQPGEDTAVRLRQQSDLRFYGYLKDQFGNNAHIAEIDFSDPQYVVSDYYTATGFYLFQLPYAMQDTDRSGISGFYDRLTVDNGIVTSIVGGVTVDNPVIETALDFYYSPHFAKNAINPSAGDEDGPDGNPDLARIRSARHLNALSRNPYYWNDSDGAFDLLFVQEADISFSAYVKEYCGETFDMMDAEGEVRNRPIGHPNDTQYGQFTGSYDGQGYQIIDYCLVSTDHFTGMFGEIFGAEIRNVVMTVSEPGMGYIHCTFAGGTIYYERVVGVGALVGLSYIDYEGRDVVTNTIENCTSVGYEVTYTLNRLQGTNRQVRGVNIGGLVGINLCDLRNCSAENDVVLIANVSDGDVSGDPVHALGGLVGTSYYRTLADCYAGGTITVTRPDGSNNVRVQNNAGIGGIAGGIMRIASNPGSNATRYENLYSYTKITVPDFVTNETVYPVVGRVDLGNVSNSQTGVNVNNIPISNTYYLTYDGQPNYGNVYGATARTYDQMDALGADDLDEDVWADAAAQSHPVDPKLRGNYPFPAVLRSGEDGKGGYIHYGDWPVPSNAYSLSESYPAYYEVYDQPDADGKTVGIYYVDVEGDGWSTLDTQNQRKITERGYGLLTMVEDGGKTAVGTGELAGITYYMYPQTLAANRNNSAFVEIEFKYKTFLGREGSVLAGSQRPYTETRYINQNFAAAIGAGELGTKTTPLQIRTPEQFLAAGQVQGETVYLQQTFTVSLADLDAPMDLPGGRIYDGGSKIAEAVSPIALIEAKITPFGVNSGTIQNTTVQNGEIVGEAGLVVTNDGLVSGCAVQNSTVTGRDAGGFVHENNGRIEKGVVREVTVTGERAAGFIHWNRGEIVDAEVLESTINGSAGFIHGNDDTGEIIGILVQGCTINGPDPVEIAAGDAGRITAVEARDNELNVVENVTTPGAG